MGAVSVLIPVVIVAWPAFSAAVVAAAASLGYAASSGQAPAKETKKAVQQEKGVTLEINRSEVVTDQLGRDQKISVTREGVTVTFSRDARGKAALHVVGEGQSEAALRALGEELSHRVVQKYVYQKLMDEIRARQFLVVEEEVDANNAIHMKVRHWES